MKKIDRGAPSLTERISSIVYILDTSAAQTRRVLETEVRKKNLAAEGGEAAERLIQEYLPAKPETIEEISYDRASGKVFLHIAHVLQKPLRPQDVVEQVFGLKDAVYIMSRDRIIYKESALVPSRP